MSKNNDPTIFLRPFTNKFGQTLNSGDKCVVVRQLPRRTVTQLGTYIGFENIEKPRVRVRLNEDGSLQTLFHNNVFPVTSRMIN